MTERNRIPVKRPILYEMFCPKCGGSLYAIAEEEIYVGRNEQSSSPAGFTITMLECVLCREEFTIDGIGLKYEAAIAEELGWPFPEKIPDSPSAIPEHLERRMREREQEPDSQGNFIEDYYADHKNRSPQPLEKDVLRYVLRQRGHLVADSNSVEKLEVPNETGTRIVQITGIDARFGLSRQLLSHTIRIADHSEGDILELWLRENTESFHRHYYIVHDGMFQPIAVLSDRRFVS